MTLSDADPILRRLERTAIGVCLFMAAAALALAGGDPGPALGVLGGGLLVAISYRSIGAGVSGLVDLLAGPSRTTGGEPGAVAAAPPRVGRTVLLMVGRYALLALLAYAMIARLRLHPIGLLAGASSVVAAAAFEAVRQITKKS
jgi:hypothetical protein